MYKDAITSNFLKKKKKKKKKYLQLRLYQRLEITYCVVSNEVIEQNIMLSFIIFLAACLVFCQL